MSTDHTGGRSAGGSGYSAVTAELAARGQDRMVLGLDRIEGLLDLLGSPQSAYPAIHLAGTNGKTSTARMLDALLRAYGLRTGRFTSPYLSTLREEISLDGEPVDEGRFVEIYREVELALRVADERNAPTFFEVTTAMALAAFADAPVDVAVVEVGLGGAEDATNVLRAATCVLTPVGLDHTEWLGETLEEIAGAEVAIVAPGSTLVCAAQDDEAMRSVVIHCAEVGATLAREGAQFDVVARRLAVGGQVLALRSLGGVYDEVFLPLHGAHQAQNAAVALAAAEAFLGRGIGPEVAREGFAAATSPGRLERVRTSPAILLDAAHNAAGMAATVAALREEFPFAHLVAVVAILADKDAAGMLELLRPLADVVVCTRNASPRSIAARELGDIAAAVLGRDRVRVAADMAEAIELAVTVADDMPEPAGAGIVVTGSIATVGEARRLLASRAPVS